jgi:AcrR family transcriptional regulator
VVAAAPERRRRSHSRVTQTAYGDRVQLSRARVIAAAMALIEADGAHAPSMTRLATELGCGLVALYCHLPSTPALLDGVACALVSDIELTESPEGDWPAQLRAQAHAVRRAAAAHPRCTIAVAGRPPVSAVQLRPAEQMLGTLLAAGFTGPDAVRIMRALAAYQVGAVLREVGADEALRATDADAAASNRPVLRTAAFPHLTAVAAELTGADSAACRDADFEFGLELLVRGMAGLRSAHQAGS